MVYKIETPILKAKFVLTYKRNQNKYQFNVHNTVLRNKQNMHLIKIQLIFMQRN